jgi:hypothetical protein
MSASEDSVVSLYLGWHFRLKLMESCCRRPAVRNAPLRGAASPPATPPYFFNCGGLGVKTLKLRPSLVTLPV